MTCHIPGLHGPRRRFFRTQVFEFELIRALWATPYGGADFEEVMTVVPAIREGDFGSWYRAWSGLARIVAERGGGLIDPVSRGNAQLRASCYMRSAEFFLSPSDSRRPSAAAFCREQFCRGLRALGVDLTRSKVPYEGVEMETMFLRSPSASHDDVLVVHGGFDSTPEELYFTIGAGAIARGFHVLIWEGPGQGQLLRAHQRTFVPDWERPASVALDSLSEHCHPRAVVGVGISLGGHLLARAAAHLDRYHGIVLFDYFPPFLAAVEHSAPPFLRRVVKRRPPGMERVVNVYARRDHELAWMIGNARWTFGTTSLAELIKRAGEFDDTAWAERIDAHVLVLVGEHEHFFDRRLAHGFVERLTSARSTRLREFRREEGGHLHCRNGAIHLAHEEIFDWIRRTVLSDAGLLAQRAFAGGVPRAHANEGATTATGSLDESR
jgi:alpha-beta hydrolase superfamily lysophospholipase